jgi:nucleoside-diphosphate-sugar epimerase
VSAWSDPTAVDNRTCFSLNRCVKTYVVSGAASGIGAATTAHLTADGHRVIGIDLHGADVAAARTPYAGSRSSRPRGSTAWRPVPASPG